MQYKIPVQIENEDIIVAGLSLRQIIVMMVWGGVGYTIFKSLESKIGAEVALIFALPVIIMGVIIALMKVSEMTFLPIILNSIRLSLNEKERIWSKGTDSFHDLEIGYILRIGAEKQTTGFAKGSMESFLENESGDKFSKL